ncbi:2-dehydropantoate 2-reductase [Leucosporidium creatinivorum]|uniref:2-dehydropantoate 2-reductase n=1 Tax=Leucosporidium creatinivorum TaxID=106004 RepID=A0A1Y2FEI7_9BASI|nr:2-dehydropantoate 2-reductase [Leucosporidium creatinivorum]
MSPSVFLFGMGAVGATHAYIFQLGGAEVTVAARSNAEVAEKKGLDFRSEKYGDSTVKFHKVVKTPSDPSLKGINYDFVVLTNKAIAMTPTASEQVEPVVGPNTTIVIIQNGVGNADQFRERFPNNIVLSAVTWVNAAQPETGVIVHKGNESMQIGVEWNDSLPKEPQQAQLEAFVALLKAGRSDYEIVPDIQQWRWKKTIWNAIWNTLTATTLCNTKEFLESSPAAEATAQALEDEMASIARALGHEIEEDYLRSLLERPDLRNGGIFSSMYGDAKAQRPMEVEVILAAPLRYAKNLGLKTPVLETCVAIVSAMDWRFQNGERR